MTNLLEHTSMAHSPSRLGEPRLTGRAAATGKFTDAFDAIASTTSEYRSTAKTSVTKPNADKLSSRNAAPSSPQQNQNREQTHQAAHDRQGVTGTSQPKQDDKPVSSATASEKETQDPAVHAGNDSLPTSSDNTLPDLQAELQTAPGIGNLETPDGPEAGLQQFSTGKNSQSGPLPSVDGKTAASAQNIHEETEAAPAAADETADSADTTASKSRQAASRFTDTNDKKAEAVEGDGFLKELGTPAKTTKASETPAFASHLSADGIDDLGKKAAPAQNRLDQQGNAEPTGVTADRNAALLQQHAHIEKNAFSNSASRFESSLSATQFSRETAPVENKAFLVNANANRITLAVEPEGLGKLNINLSLHQGVVNAHIQAADPAAKNLLESNMQEIVNTLMNEGVEVGGFSVTLRHGEPGSAHEEKMHGGSSAAAREKATGSASVHSFEGNNRINLFV